MGSQRRRYREMIDDAIHTHAELQRATPSVFALCGVSGTELLDKDLARGSWLSVQGSFWMGLRHRGDEMKEYIQMVGAFLGIAGVAAVSIYYTFVAAGYIQ